MNQKEWQENIDNLNRILSFAQTQINLEFEDMEHHGDESYFDYLWSEKSRIAKAKQFVSTLKYPDTKD